MSGYGKSELADFPPSDAENPMFYGTFLQAPYNHHHLLQPTANQDVDFQFVSQDIKPPVQHMRNFSLPHSRAPSTNSIQQPNLKRKASLAEEYDLPAQKRAAVAQVQVQDPQGDYYDLSGQTSPGTPFVLTPTGSTGLPVCAPNFASPKPSGHHYSTSTASQVSLAAPSPHTPAFNSPSFATVKSEQSPKAPVTPIPRPATSSPLKSSVPKLVRTSTMQQSPPGSFTGMAIGQPQAFNPYAMHPLKANLKLSGDLETMKEAWTQDEKEARRRLVEFRRSQLNSTITAEFKPVAPQDRQPSSICISCIWWKEKNEFYVTSVDTIYLLEALVGVRFTVEEKNRIRRNLEGFRPMTVSKLKPDSEEFFKVIMGFPHPKPRNIEKDVKVFPWKILSTALKKIISKYSASYSSTASVVNSSSMYSDNHVVDFRYMPSPQQEYMPATGSYPVMNPEMHYMTAPQPMRMQAPPQIPELQLQVPEYRAFDNNGQYYYQLVQTPQGAMAMHPGPMTAPINRPNMDFAFANAGTVTTAPHSAPATAYQHTFFENNEFVPPMHYQQH
ncbi:uncharacterized protein PV06_03813 [Exophiala oligosperma]|uniref:DUF7082 domain-containing protein n=2 Tax=Chaetothyriales TaxID=34395 RepID=A0A0D2DSI7_9EURO|nr:uncharacterized protein PV06_03813 [Exophiala oligosperma]KAJ9624380.1 hypothetical protein H2204_010833 [Knufia peltigerae]KIW45420.1 hypothetical protein PV06_03813 [Exophiala oligosperma]